VHEGHVGAEQQRRRAESPECRLGDAPGRQQRADGRRERSEVAATPTTDIDSGSVASAGAGAMWVPTMPANEISTMVPQAASACASVSSQTWRIGLPR
jgi:hypothetical protein